MANTWFRFKQFTIEQAHSPMKVGVDGVLLGAWAIQRYLALPEGQTHGRAMDVGTGTGLIALMAAQETQMRIDAVETNKGALRDAALNFSRSPWTGRLNLIPSSFQAYLKSQPGQFDLIITNPPFFHRSLKPIKQGRAEARHSDSLPAGELLSGVAKLLASAGRFYLIIPADHVQRIEEQSQNTGLFIHNQCHVKPTPAKAPHRVMLGLGHMQTPVTKEELVIESGGRHSYSPGYKKLARKYYLHFE